MHGGRKLKEVSTSSEYPLRFYQQATFCEVFIEYLLHQGINYFVFSPGARNSPLILALLKKQATQSISGNEGNEEKVFVHTHFDERGSAFFALGLLKATDKKVAVMTTSGSAVANLLPALSEAHYDSKSLLIITADRPPELHGLGSNQTMEQDILQTQLSHYFNFDPNVYWKNIYGSESTVTQQPYSPLCSRLAGALQFLEQGSVQINLALREPLSTVGEKLNGLREFRKDVALEIGEEDGESETTDNTHHIVDEVCAKLQLTKTMEGIQGNEKYGEQTPVIRGVLIIGELKQSKTTIDKAEVDATIECFKKMGWLVIADPLSGLSRIETCYYYDALFKWLCHSKNNHLFQFRFLHLGGRLVSKWWFEFFKLINKREHKESKVMVGNPMTYYHINDTQRLHYDPAEVIDKCFKIDPLLFCKAFNTFKSRSDLAFVEDGNKEELNLGNELTNLLCQFKSQYEVGHYEKDSENNFSEISIWSSLENNFMGKELDLFVGNSMPIRDYCEHVYLDGVQRVFTNRGLSGIDGLVATAIGVACGLYERDKMKGKPFYTVMGDLSFLHDMNSLALFRGLSEVIPKMVFIVINNKEGTIFKQIGLGKEVAKEIDKELDKERNKYNVANPKVFEQLYYRHDFEFEAVAKLFHLQYFSATNDEELKKVLEEVKDIPTGYFLVEISSDSEINFKEHQNFYQRLVTCLDNKLSMLSRMS